jgi:hypothetical protein
LRNGSSSRAPLADYRRCYCADDAQREEQGDAGNDESIRHRQALLRWPNGESGFRKRQRYQQHHEQGSTDVSQDAQPTRDTDDAEQIRQQPKDAYEQSAVAPPPAAKRAPSGVAKPAEERFQPVGPVSTRHVIGIDIRGFSLNRSLSEIGKR